MGRREARHFDAFALLLALWLSGFLAFWLSGLLAASSVCAS